MKKVSRKLRNTAEKKWKATIEDGGFKASRMMAEYMWISVENKFVDDDDDRQ